LFSGCGGCSLGLQRAGFQVELAADIDGDACKTHAANLKHHGIWRVDLSKVSADDILLRSGVSPADVDLIVGGPPCQGFSSAGARDWTDSRNVLLRRFVDIVTAVKPTWFVMENVEGLLTANDGFYIVEAITRFLEAGYWVRANKIYMEQYGLPQRRKRVFVVGNLEEAKFEFPPPFCFEAPQLPMFGDNHILSVEEAIGDLPPPSDSPAAYCVHPQCDYQAKMRQTYSEFVEHHIVKELNDTVRQRIQILAPGATMRDLPQNLQHPSFKRRAFRRVMDGTPTEKRGGAPSGLKRLIATAPSLTITSASPNEFVHPTQDRLLTLRECARLQSFPDWYEFHGS
jgi:DNA (cytosine-5)-methyltransferase 1